EDCGITVIPRRGLRPLVNGYAPTDPRYIVIEETYASYGPAYRGILAEEFCHILLEYDLLATGKVPDNWQPHNLNFEQHQTIERDAQYLARAILIARDIFAERWKEFFEKAPPAHKATREKNLIFCGESLEAVFRCSPLTIAYRARDVGLISPDECKKCFSDRIPM
ncbi:MAG TPA: ImmA/IrrE family metallo-endopeptidase, partial [Verrucomicrobiae bacterium]|nr:ImmA/IrrE family metallo-endopeptidase [Verrucomicrobiae bacterium]